MSYEWKVDIFCYLKDNDGTSVSANVTRSGGPKFGRIQWKEEESLNDAKNTNKYNTELIKLMIKSTQHTENRI